MAQLMHYFADEQIVEVVEWKTDHWGNEYDVELLSEGVDTLGQALDVVREHFAFPVSRAVERDDDYQGRGVTFTLPVQR